MRQICGPYSPFEAAESVPGRKARLSSRCVKRETGAARAGPAPLVHSDDVSPGPPCRPLGSIFQSDAQVGQASADAIGQGILLGLA